MVGLRAGVLVGGAVDLLMRIDREKKKDFVCRIFVVFRPEKAQLATPRNPFKTPLETNKNC